jgi:hypothetical protein
MRAAQETADILTWPSNTLGEANRRESPGQRAVITRNSLFCELIPDVIFFSGHYHRKYIHQRTEMRNQRHRSELEPWQNYDQLVTDSVVLSEIFVASAIKNNRNYTPDPLSVARGILSGLVLSLLFWTPILLAFLVY